MDDQTSRQPQVQPVPEQSQPTSPMPEVQPLPQLEVEPATSLVSLPPLPPSGGEDMFIPPFTQPATPKKSKKRLAIILAAVLVVLIGGGVSVYAFWYQNPEKVITDGVIHAIQAKSIEYTGTLNVTVGSNKTKVEITGADVSNAHKVGVKVTMPNSFTGKEMTFEGEGVFDAKSDLYVKVKNIDQITSPYRSLFGPATQKSFDEVVAKINDKWIKISATDLAGLSQEASKTQTCTGEVIKKYANDSSAISEIADAYKKNKFVVVDQNLGTKDGSLGYTMKSDESKTKAFIEAIKTTKIYTALHECDNNFTLSSSDIAVTPESTTQSARAEIWVSQWTHQITKIVALSTIPQEEESPAGKMETFFEPRFDTSVAISAPEASTTLAELKTDIEKLITDAQTEYATGYQLKV